MLKKMLVVTAVVAAGLFVFAGCETTPTQQGALMGGALGAGAGAIIGNQVHHQGGNGALIGAAGGALAGALIGDAMGQHKAHQVQQAPPPPAPAPAPAVSSGHWETRTVTTASGETYEERVWVQDR